MRAQNSQGQRKIDTAESEMLWGSSHKASTFTSFPKVLINEAMADQNSHNIITISMLLVILTAEWIVLTGADLC
jgi:hypothetical protein